MSSIKVKFRKPASEDAEGKLYFQIIHERVSRQWCSDYKIYSTEWDSKKSTLILPADNPERKAHLMRIRDRVRCDVRRLRNVIAELTAKSDNISADEIMEEFADRQNCLSVFAFMKTVITRMRELGKQRTSETYATALNSLLRYRKGEDLTFDEVDSDMMESYQSYLREKGLIPNSISFHTRILRAVYNRAIEKGITEDKKPFRHVYTGVDKTIKRAIEVGAIKRIKEADFSGSPKLKFARDIFMLSFYLRGMSFVDMAYLKKSDMANGQVVYRRRKTGQQLMIRWTSEMQDILDQYPANPTEYLLPIITDSAELPYRQYRRRQYQINKSLKTIAGRVGLGVSLSLYCSRHSWASIAKSKGIPIGVISDGLGHDSELTTQIYLSTLDTSAVDRANALIMQLF